MPDLVQLEKKLLAHDLQRTDFPRILLRRQVDLSIATLSNLGENLEVTMLQSRTALSQIGPLST